MEQTRPFEPHDVVWTREASSRFWDFIAKNTPDADYFSNAVGDDLLTLLRGWGVVPHGRVLDFGCGRGFFLAKLCARGIHCEGADFSPGSIDATRARVGGLSSFRGAHLLEGLPSSLPGEAFDLVFAIEVVEHLLDGDLSSTLAEIHRVLKRGGRVVITTPNQENLDASKVLCPECGCTFHRVQHVRAWSATSLSRILREHGFEVTTCAGTRLASRALRPLFSLPYGREVGIRVLRNARPHLVCVARKP